ncbi:unnamed protein product [Prunus armeniaca]
MPNDRRTRDKFSLTSHAERQTRGGRVFTYLPCRTVAHSGRAFTHPQLILPFPSNLPTSPLAWGLGGLHDHHQHDQTTKDACTRVRMPELSDKQVSNQEVPPRSETWRTPVCTISDPPLTS